MYAYIIAIVNTEEVMKLKRREWHSNDINTELMHGSSSGTMG